MGWIRRTVPSVLLDGALVLALAFPDVSAYLRWPLFGIYVLISVAILRAGTKHRWFFTIIRDPATRLTHGLEHATMAILEQQELPVIHGFTHRRDRFVVALRERVDTTVVRDASTAAISRMQAGERDLAYHPGCGTSDVVFPMIAWLVFVLGMVFTLLVGGSIPMFFVVTVIVLRIWLATGEAIGLLAQRWFTVSSDFIAATVTDVHETRKVTAYVCPHDEYWYEVIVDIEIGATQGGLVIPG